MSLSLFLFAIARNIYGNHQQKKHLEASSRRRNIVPFVGKKKQISAPLRVETYEPCSPPTGGINFTNIHSSG